MSNDFSYDPVTAIDESNATGDIAAVFADIRETMNIPLVTSIWRGLAGMGDGLREAWSAAKPVFESGQPARALDRIIEATALPAPTPLVAGQLTCLGIGPEERNTLRTLIRAYNRSNGMNLVALAALVNTPLSQGPSPRSYKTRLEWPPLPLLLARGDIGDDVWSMIRQVNRFGASGVGASVATLWRHLAHWPAWISLVHAAYAPFQDNGAIDRASAHLVQLAALEAGQIAHLVPTGAHISEPAHTAIVGYVTHPEQVARMVTMGYAMANWLDGGASR